MPMMPLRRLFAAGLVCMVSLSREASAQSCSAMTVTGGASPGTYERTSDILEDRNVYTQTEDGEVVAIFRFYEGSLRRRLEENFEGLDDGMAAGRTLRGVGQAAIAAEEGAGRSLTACATGFWANLEGGVPATSTSDTADILYPFYVTADCADDPSEVTADWLSVACESCEQVADETLTIECTASTYDLAARLTLDSDGTHSRDQCRGWAATAHAYKRREDHYHGRWMTGARGLPKETNGSGKWGGSVMCNG